MLLVFLLNFDIVARALIEILDTRESDLRDVFSAYGSVSKVNMPIDRETVSIIHAVNFVVLSLFQSTTYIFRDYLLIGPPPWFCLH